MRVAGAIAGILIGGHQGIALVVRTEIKAPLVGAFS